MKQTSNRQANLAAIILGMGLGGFFDGTVLHMILHWHQMLSSAGYPPDTLSNMHVNMFWGGIFHAAMWILILIGIIILWQAKNLQNQPFRLQSLLGLLLAGWGLFNVIEGTIDHQILGLHHVKEDEPNIMAWDIGFLLISAAMIGIGWLMHKRSVKEFKD